MMGTTFYKIFLPKKLISILEDIATHHKTAIDDILNESLLNFTMLCSDKTEIELVSLDSETRFLLLKLQAQKAREFSNKELFMIHLQNEHERKVD